MHGSVNIDFATIFLIPFLVLVRDILEQFWSLEQSIYYGVLDPEASWGVNFFSQFLHQI